jgi:EAL domain-containing protein (putative c-di-GMP-specific phosphodiesterase class I)
MGMTATAEGVETSEQFDAIKSEGCTEMQGFLFSRPLPAEEIERLFLSGAEASEVKASKASGSKARKTNRRIIAA